MNMSGAFRRAAIASVAVVSMGVGVSVLAHRGGSTKDEAKLGIEHLHQLEMWKPRFRAYHAYSFQNVKESDSGRLLQEFLTLSLPRLLLYGDDCSSLDVTPSILVRLSLRGS